MTSVRPAYFSTLVYPLIVVLTTLFYVALLRRHVGINSDAVTYLQGTGAYLQGGGVSAVTSVGSQASWPFYSIYIAWTSLLLHTTPVTAAYILNGFFINATACLFVYLCCLLNKDAKTPWIALALWLSWSIFTNAWPMIVRDFVYYFVFLLSALFYYRFAFGNRRFFWGSLWFISVLVAFSLRLEGVAFLTLGFFIASLHKKREARAVLKLVSLTLLVVFIFIIFFAFAPKFSVMLANSKFMLIRGQVLSFLPKLVTSFDHDVSALRHTFFMKDSPVFVGLFLILFRCASALHQALLNIGLVALYSLIQFFIAKKLCHKKLYIVCKQSSLLGRAFFLYSLLSLAIVIAFYLDRHFINPRYLFPFSLLALIFICSLTSNFFACIDRALVRRLLLCLWLIVCAVVFVTDFANFKDSLAKRMGSMEAASYLGRTYPGQRATTNIKPLMYYLGDAPVYDYGVLAPYTNKGLGRLKRFFQRTEAVCSTKVLLLALPSDAIAQSLSEWLVSQGIVSAPFERLGISLGRDAQVYVASINEKDCIKFYTA